MREIKLYEQWLTEIDGPADGSLFGTSGVDFGFIGLQDPGDTPNSFEPHMVESFIVDLLQRHNNTVPAPGTLTVEYLRDITQVQTTMSDKNRSFVQAVNNNPMAFHVEDAKKAGIDLDGKWLTECWDYATEVAATAKDIWKVKRPFEIDSRVKGLVPTKSFSFPSANAAGSFYVAKKVGEKYPQLKESQMEVATQIANSRVVAGVHHPLDIAVGKMLALGLL